MKPHEMTTERAADRNRDCQVSVSARRFVFGCYPTVGVGFAALIRRGRPTGLASAVVFAGAVVHDGVSGDQRLTDCNLDAVTDDSDFDLASV